MLTNAEIERMQAREGGFYLPSGREPQPKCVTCHGRGEFNWFQTESRIAVVTYRCNCIDQWVLYSAFLNANIAWSFQTLDWPDMRGIKDSTIDFIAAYMDKAEGYIQAGLGMFLWSGEPGTGKSALSALVLKQLILAGVECYFTTYSELVDTYKEGWDEIESKVWYHKRVKTVKVLVIDEIGGEWQRGFSDHYVDEILRSRLSQGVPTIFTSNRSLDEMERRYGPNVASLLSQAVLVHEVKGSDYRIKAQIARQQEVEHGLTRPVVG